MNRLFTFLSICLSHLVYRLFFLVPRQKNLVVCIGWHTSKERELFADNAKYFFLYLAQHQPTIRAIWLSRDNKLPTILRARGYEAYSIHSLKGIWYALRARQTYIDAFLERSFWRYTGGSDTIQLWHGKGMKKTGHDSGYSLKSRNRFSQPNMFAPLCALIASSSYTAKLMASTFKAPLDKVAITGLPRNDVLFGDIKDAELDSHLPLQEKINQARQSGAGKIFLYAPTFRPNGSNPIDTLDLAALEQVLANTNAHLFVSLHPKFARKDAVQLSSYQHIEYVEAGFDIYPQLKNIDVLITDYSSLYVDFLLLDRPIIFYTYDIDTYGVEMGLHDDFDSLTPGPHPKTINELLIALAEKDTYQEKRAQVRKHLFQDQDGEASKRVFTALI